MTLWQRSTLSALDYQLSPDRWEHVLAPEVMITSMPDHLDSSGIQKARVALLDAFCRDSNATGMVFTTYSTSNS
jgi:hypothetical protein